MIKLLLPLMLLTSDVHAESTPSVCNELLDVMTEYVMEGELEYKEAMGIYERCIAMEL